MKADQDRRNQSPVRYLPALDGLRGLAILLVLFLHFTIIEPRNGIESALVNLASLGTHGVDLFFVLSGFLVTRILLEARGKPHFFRNFYMRRVLRIFPIYYLLIFISFVVLPVFLNAVPDLGDQFQSLDADPKQWAWYVFFASNFLAAIEQRFTHDILGVSWSLAIEEHFYLVWPWFVACLNAKILKRLLWVVILTALILRSILWFDGWTPIQIYVVTFTRMDTIALGALLALSLQSDLSLIGEAEKKKTFYALVMGLVFIIGAFSGGWFDVKSTYLNTFMYTAVGIFFYILVRTVVLHQNEPWVRYLFTNRVMMTIGRYSYALYLLHIPVRVLIRNLWLGESQFRAWPGGALLWQCVFYGVAFSATFILAWLSWHLIEKRFLALKRFF